MVCLRGGGVVEIYQLMTVDFCGRGRELSAYVGGVEVLCHGVGVVLKFILQGRSPHTAVSYSEAHFCQMPQTVGQAGYAPESSVKR